MGDDNRHPKKGLISNRKSYLQEGIGKKRTTFCEQRVLPCQEDSEGVSDEETDDGGDDGEVEEGRMDVI
jgi:hypothetical protein